MRYSSSDGKVEAVSDADVPARPLAHVDEVR
jgi:hypothetical protein